DWRGCGWYCLAQRSGGGGGLLAQHLGARRVLLPSARQLVTQPLLQSRERGFKGPLLRQRIEAKASEDHRRERRSQDRDGETGGGEQLYGHSQYGARGASSRPGRELRPGAVRGVSRSEHRANIRQKLVHSPEPCPAKLW